MMIFSYVKCPWNPPCLRILCFFTVQGKDFQAPAASSAERRRRPWVNVEEMDVADFCASCAKSWGSPEAWNCAAQAKSRGVMGGNAAGIYIIYIIYTRNTYYVYILCSLILPRIATWGWDAQKMEGVTRYNKYLLRMEPMQTDTHGDINEQLGQHWFEWGWTTSEKLPTKTLARSSSQF